MKRILSLILAVTLVFATAACSTNNNATSPSAGTSATGQDSERIAVKIGITGESENDIWAPVIAAVANEGIDVEIINFADYVLPNEALSNGDIDLNAFQHYAYLNNQIDDKGYDFVAIGDMYISAMCIYSDKIKDVSEVKSGDKVAIPNDAVNLGRALSVAQGAGLITLSGPANGNTYETVDISSNPLNLEFVEVEGVEIPALLPDVTIGIINGNYAVDYGLSPQRDAIFYDDVAFYQDNRYVNVIVARGEDVNNPVYLKIVQAYQSDAVEQVYKDKFDGSYLPGWKSRTNG